MNAGPPMATKALLLDLDGTLAASVDVLTRVYYRFLELRGRVGSDMEFAELNGPSLAEVVAMLKARHDLDGHVDALVGEYRLLVQEIYQNVEPNAGAHELIDAAQAAGWTICVVTSNIRDTACRWLERVGLRDKVAEVVTGEAVSKGKPHPEIYRTALRLCGCTAARALAVEDSPMGATSAVAAGVETYVLSSTDGLDVGLWPQGVHRIEHLAELIPIVRRGM